MDLFPAPVPGTSFSLQVPWVQTNAWHAFEKRDRKWSRGGKNCGSSPGNGSLGFIEEAVCSQESGHLGGFTCQQLSDRLPSPWSVQSHSGAPESLSFQSQLSLGPPHLLLTQHSGLLVASLFLLFSLKGLQDSGLAHQITVVPSLLHLCHWSPTWRKLCLAGLLFVSEWVVPVWLSDLRTVPICPCYVPAQNVFLPSIFLSIPSPFFFFSFSRLGLFV